MIIKNFLVKVQYGHSVSTGKRRKCGRDKN